MAFLFDIAPLPSGCRHTFVWDDRRRGHERTGQTVTAHFVVLPGDQHADIESDFVSSHLPFSIGGVAGTFPDGSPWLLVLQLAASPPERPWFRSEELRVLDQAMRRIEDLNPGAEADEPEAWSRDELVAVYESRDVNPLQLQLWSTAELVAGLLAECCGTPLVTVADGFLSGCAFPDLAHPCEQDVFLDVFARWQGGRSAAGPH